MIYVTRRGRGERTEMGRKPWNRCPRRPGLAPLAAAAPGRPGGDFLPSISAGDGDARLPQEKFRILNFGLGRAERKRVQLLPLKRIFVLIMKPNSISCQLLPCLTPVQRDSD